MRHGVRLLVAGLVALVAITALAAAAAGLGGLSIAGLGADSTPASSCDSDGVALAYSTAYNPSSFGFEVTTVTLSGVDRACAGKTYQLDLRGASGSLSENAGVVSAPGGVQVVTLAPAPAASLVVGASLVFTG